MKKVENLKEKGALIKADIYSRDNAINGKYRAAKLGLENLTDIKDSNIFLLETLQMKANLADKMIADAESQGKNTNDPETIRELGERINAVGTSISRSQAVGTAIWDSFFYIILYALVVGIWASIFNASFLRSARWGALIGIAISLLSVGPVIAFQRTKEKVRDMSFGAGQLWGKLGIILGILGVITFVVKVIFLK